MKSLKSGLFGVVLAVTMLTLWSSSAFADPIGGPWSGSGRINIDGGLYATSCTAVSLTGTRDGNSVNTTTFGGCMGAFGTPSALLPWSVVWNARNNGGTIGLRILATLASVAQCLWAGNVSFTYASGTRTITIVQTALPLVAQLGGPRICPATVAVTGGIVVR